MPSSAIRHIFYKPDQQELSVWFNPEGRRYKYFDVPSELYEGLRDAPSRGRYFNQAIRGRFDCRIADIPEKHARRRQAVRSS